VANKNPMVEMGNVHMSFMRLDAFPGAIMFGISVLTFSFWDDDDSTLLGGKLIRALVCIVAYIGSFVNEWCW
jgi:hypothetical protein